VTRSFIDVLFILLLSTIAMLTQTVRVGALDTELLDAGSGGVSHVRAEEVEIVVITAAGLRHDERLWTDAAQLAGVLPAGAPVLLVVTDDAVRHHEVISVWSELTGQGFDVNLGAPTRSATPDGTPGGTER